jgi:hypothetical protein
MHGSLRRRRRVPATLRILVRPTRSDVARMPEPEFLGFRSRFQPSRPPNAENVGALPSSRSFESERERERAGERRARRRRA